MSSNPEGLSATILGCKGARLDDAERSFFAHHRPLGFILFARNIVEPNQVRALVAELEASVGRGDAPIMIDQEGGRVQRLRPPHWRQYPAAARRGDLGDDRAAIAVRDCARLIAEDLHALGIDMNCAPVLDVRQPGAHDVIGDRAFAAEPQRVADLGRACAEGLADGGVVPIGKHIPGHGRAAVDSHHELPRVTADRATLARCDFAPFRALADLPWMMTAHVVYEAYDSRAATVSRAVIDGVVRGEIGFAGVLVSDDLSMNALGGTLGERAAAARDAGCDVVLHCNGDAAEMAAVIAAAGAIGEAGARRLAAGSAWRRSPAPFDRAGALARLAALMPASAA